MNALMIVGTDTDAGKTVLTTALIAYWQQHCRSRSIGVIKPFQTGTGDRETYQRLFDLDQTLEELNPVHFSAPFAPPIAADLEDCLIPIAPAWQAFSKLCAKRDFVLVEGLGGLGSPVTHETTVADLAWDWRIPIVIVVPVKLGAIGQAVANVALARQTKLNLRGIILNCIAPDSESTIEQIAPIKLIERLTDSRVLGVLPYLTDKSDRSILAQAASMLTIEALLPLNLSIDR